jgi:hypothetical protein
MLELEMDRIEYENYKQEGAPDMCHLFEKSIKLLGAARKKIVGY